MFLLVTESLSNFADYVYILYSFLRKKNYYLNNKYRSLNKDIIIAHCFIVMRLSLTIAVYIFKGIVWILEPVPGFFYHFLNPGNGHNVTITLQ